MDIENPYWDRVKDNVVQDDFSEQLTVGGYPRYSRETKGLDPDQLNRHDFVRQYSWAIADPSTLEFCVKHSDGKIVEIGAGTGYFAWCLAQLSVQVVAYDEVLVDSGLNHYHMPVLQGRTTVPVRSWFPVLKGGPDSAALHPASTLFLCWPPYRSDMATKCLRSYTGNKVINIGEPPGGCTGDDEFHEILDKEWTLVAEHEMVQWWGLHDNCYVYRRI